MTVVLLKQRQIGTVMTSLSHRCSVLLLVFSQMCCATTAIRGSSLVQSQLRGIAGVQVVAYVKPWQNARTADALARRLRAITEEELRQGAMRGPAVALFSIEVDTERSKSCASAISVALTIQLREKVHSVRAEGGETAYDASTWSRRILLITSADDANAEIEKAVKELTEVFVADVQEANKQ